MGVQRPEEGSGHGPTRVIRSNLADHPAVRAWRRLGGGRAKPESIQVLKEVLRGKRYASDRFQSEGTSGYSVLELPRSRSAVYRLVGVGPEGGAVVAKRCFHKQSNSAATECVIYEQVLPRLPISALRCYGTVDDDNECRWLFLEDAGDERYALEVEEHRVLAGRWLGAMNTSAQHLAVGEALPDRSASFYLEGLRRARAMITNVLGHPVARADDRRRTLEAIIGHCDRLETLWPSIERFCERMPRTLVHCDLVSKNVRIRAEETGKSFLVMDWETAGWGIPAADLAQFPLERSHYIALSPDLQAYWTVVHPRWPNISLPDLRRLAELGNAFRLIVALAWMNEGFHEYEWYMTDMGWYEPELRAWLGAADFQAS